MKAVAKISDESIAKMPLTISLTMTVEEWRDLMRQAPSSWPSWKVASHISACLGHIARFTSFTFVDPLHERSQDTE